MLSQTEIDHIAELLRSGSAFQGMPTNVARRIAVLMELKQFPAGEKLTTEGKANSGSLIILISGEA